METINEIPVVYGTERRNMDVRTIQSITIQHFILFLYDSGVAINLEILEKKREEFLAMGDKLVKS